MKSSALLVCVFLLSGCAHSTPERDPSQRPARLIYVHASGWHTGIIVSAADVPAAIWPESRDFPGYRYLRVGWGDRDFYRASRFNLWYAFKALFWPTASVLHIVAFDEDPQRYYAPADTIALGVSEAGFRRLCAYIHDSYAHDGAGNPIVLGPGLYGVSRFYLSRERYHLFKTSNVWTAKALQRAGVPVEAGGALTREGLFRQLREVGEGVGEGVGVGVQSQSR